MKIFIFLFPLLLLSCGGSFYPLELSKEDIKSIKEILEENGCNLDSNSYEYYMELDTFSSSGSYGYGSDHEVYHLVLPSETETKLILSDKISNLHNGFKGVKSWGNGKLSTIEVKSDSTISLENLNLSNENFTEIDNSFDKLLVEKLNVINNPLDSFGDVLFSLLPYPNEQFSFTYDSTIAFSDTLGRWLNKIYKIPYNSVHYPILDLDERKSIRSIYAANGIAIPSDAFVDEYLFFYGKDGGFYDQYAIPLNQNEEDSLVLTDDFNGLSDKFMKITVPPRDTPTPGPIKEIIIRSDSIIIIDSLLLANQQIKSLPEEIAYLRVKRLDLSYNQIDTLSESIMGLTRIPYYDNPYVNLTFNLIDSTEVSFLLKTWLNTYAKNLWPTQNVEEE